ncbi:shikimate kinase [Synechococcus moorigangaii CMS01]|nr:shikimate kinase [Synechococcus moorigangaii CMS01]
MDDLLKGLNIYLIGMMGTGKSTLAEIIAELMNYRSLDSDSIIETLAKQSISEIFAEMGEAEFRQLETQVLKQIAVQTRTVVATGGGIVVSQANWYYLRQGLTIWLDVPVPILVERLRSDTSRPLLQNVDLERKLTQLLQQRRSLYAEADLHIQISGNRPPRAVAEDIIAQIPSVLRKPPELIGDRHQT